MARDDRERYAELVQEFHDVLIAGADNSKLEAHYRMLMNQLAYSRLVNTSLSQLGARLSHQCAGSTRGTARCCPGRRVRGCGRAS
ncbi:hypothetical protein [Streptomyces violens]|uniref:hypothetical protein n=1 Tax=Streptomyces violens TaxID=66377 RepID=UPI001FDEE2D9|nr:hypothetical protein [Streptomyces violens]